MEFNGHTDYMDIGKSGTEGNHTHTHHFISEDLGGDGFSFFARVRVTKLTPWARIFDFGSPDGKYNIMAGLRGDSDNIVFEVHNGDNHILTYITITVDHENAYLFVVKENGNMQIWRDGYLLKQQSADGMDVKRVERDNLFIGKPDFMHEDGDDSYFRGSIEDIKVFNSAVDWSAVTEERGTSTWPGLTNGDFDPEQETYQISTYSKAIPFGWIARGTTELCTARGVEMLGGTIPEEPAGKLFVGIEKHSELRQTIDYLTKGKTYWIFFRAGISLHNKEELPRLSVLIDDDPYLDALSLGAGEWTEQLISFVADRSDGKAEIIFKNSEDMDGHVFIGDVKVSDFPNCYEKLSAQTMCVHDSSDPSVISFEGHKEDQCREECEKRDCQFLLFDPVTYEGSSHCAIYPDCGVTTEYYDGQAGVLFRRMPCAVGGMMSPAAAKTYTLPQEHLAHHNSEHVGNDTAHHHHSNHSDHSNHSNSSMADQYYYENTESVDPLVGPGPYHSRDEGSSVNGKATVEHFAHGGTSSSQGSSHSLANEVDFPAALSAKDLGLHNT